MKPVLLTTLLVIFTALTPVHGQQADISEVRADTLRTLAQDWNQFRNQGNVNALVDLFHPNDRILAREYYAGERKGNSKVSVLKIEEPARGRFLVTIERSWGGAQPGKIQWVLEAADLDGDLYLRIPGGNLRPSPAVVARAKAAGSDQLVVTQPSVLTASNQIAVPQEPVELTPQKTIAIKTQTPAITEIKPPAKKPAPPKKVLPPFTRFDQWARICQENDQSQSSCHAEIVLSDLSTEEVFFAWQITDAGQGRFNSILRTPSGVLLTAGLAFSPTPGPAMIVPYHRCQEDACELQLAIESDLLKVLLSRTTLPAQFINAQDETVKFEIPMRGFAKAIRSLPPTVQPALPPAAQP
jgi:invasion protein IalB